MSRTLSKILVVCAVIAILPLMIVGTAFATYYSFESTISIGLYFVNGETAEGANAKAAVRYDGIDKTEDFTISKGHMDKANLDIPTPVGYEFKGWYEGDKASYEAETDKESVIKSLRTLSVNMENGKQYLAIFEVIQYRVYFRYDLEPTNSVVNDQTTVPSTDQYDFAGQEYATYNFGYTLPVLSGVSGWRRNGWRMYKDSTIVEEGDPYFVAEFSGVEKNEEGIREVTLSYDWKANPQVIVTYYDNETRSEIVSERVDRDNTAYNFDERFKALVEKNEKEPEVGYYWNGYVDAQGHAIPTVRDFTDSKYDSSTPMNPAKEDVYVTSKAVEYTAKVVTNEEGFSYNGSKIKFTIKDLSADTGAANFETLFANVFTDNKTNYTKKYTFFTFKGVTVGTSLVQEVSGLKSALTSFINDNAHATAELTLTAEFNSQFNVQVTTVGGVKFRYSDDNGLSYEDKVYYQDKNTSGYIERQDTTIQSKSSSITLREFLNIGNDEKFYTSSSATEEAKFFSVEIKGNQITVYDLTLDSTMNDVIQALLDKGDNFSASGNTFTLKDILVIFA